MKALRKVVATVFIVLAPAAVFAGGEKPPAHQKKAQATDAQQQLIEVAAARAMVSAFGRIDLRNDALDARVYGAHYDGPAKGDAGPQYESTNLPSHTAQHLRAVADMISIGAIVDDTGRCIPLIPEPCRIGSYAGLVAFSAAWIVGDTAAIAVKRATVRTPVTESRQGVAEIAVWVLN